MTGPQDVTEWIQLVRSEYLESPGLQLTNGQVQRLWGLDPSTCEAILEALEQALFLKRTNANRYVRANGQNDSQSTQSCRYVLSSRLSLRSTDFSKGEINKLR
jgi:hypothetical protein